MKKRSNLVITSILYRLVLVLLLSCKKPEDPAPNTPALSFTLQGKKYSYTSNGIKDISGKVADAFGYNIVKGKKIKDAVTHIEVIGSSNNESLHFIADYKSYFPLEGDSVYYSLTVGSKVYKFQNLVTPPAEKNYISAFTGTTATFYKGEFHGSVPFFTDLGTVQNIKIEDGTFLVTKSADQ
jgi:hypothetical protein